MDVTLCDNFVTPVILPDIFILSVLYNYLVLQNSQAHSRSQSVNGPPNAVAPEIEESEMVCIHLVGKIKTLLFVSYNSFRRFVMVDTWTLESMYIIQLTYACFYNKMFCIIRKFTVWLIRGLLQQSLQNECTPNFLFFSSITPSEIY